MTLLRRGLLVLVILALTLKSGHLVIAGGLVLLLLVAAAPTPAGVPMLKLEPDPDGAAALARILARDPAVIPVLEEEFLGYAPRATERAEELLSADAAHARHKE